eukprot:GEMP01030778.1.p1 GENE.GEMP01030778.1~~GEMP01030778.1.p1  ORF type:complete len:379 (+),score=72.19 GEMP01030778.1:130-1266(+)
MRDRGRVSGAGDSDIESGEHDELLDARGTTKSIRDFSRVCHRYRCCICLFFSGFFAVLLLVQRTVMDTSVVITDPGELHVIDDQLQTTASKSSERHLRYVCGDSGLCGGWGSRWKGAVTAYYFAQKTNRTFHMVWVGTQSNLTNYFEPAEIIVFDCPNAERINWIGVAVGDEEIEVIMNSHAPCIDLHANYVPFALTDEYKAYAVRLWQALPLLRPPLRSTLDQIPSTLVCAQIRLGNSTTMKDIQSKLPTGSHQIVYDNNGLPSIQSATAKPTPRRILLWTDSSMIEEKFYHEFSDIAVRLPGSIGHFEFIPDGMENKVQDWLMRVLLEWVLIGHCDDIAYQPNSGFIESGLFLAKPTATLVPTTSWTDAHPTHGAT